MAAERDEGDLSRIIRELREMVQVLRQQASTHLSDMYRPTREMIDQHEKECNEEFDKKLESLHQSILDKLLSLERTNDSKITSIISDIRNIWSVVSKEVETQTKPVLNGAKTTHAKLEPLEQIANATKIRTDEHEKIINGYTQSNEKVPGLIDHIKELNKWKRASEEKDRTWMEQWKFWIMVAGFFFTVAMGVLSVIFTLYKLNADMKQVEQKMMDKAENK
jgi:vacuolar-type H+-ATPase subunit H